jgi:hypothetical protein
MFCWSATCTLNDMKFARSSPKVEVIKPRAHGSLRRIAIGAVLAGVTPLCSGIAMADVASAGTLHPSVYSGLTRHDTLIDALQARPSRRTLPLSGLRQDAARPLEVPSAALRPAQIAALDGLVANRLNAIRASFGLASGQATTSYTAEVTKAVMSNEDPPFAPATGGVVAEGSLWGVVPGGASGSSTSSALEIVDGWVYHDGWEGSVQATWNADCTSAHAAGCEGHRRNVLATPPTPGAKLYIDVTTSSVSFDGSPALAVAALFVWKTGSVMP